LGKANDRTSLNKREKKKINILCMNSIGSVHLVLSALPAKILKAISAFGWKPDKQLGFILLNQCAESKRVRSSMATIMLMAYYTAAISFAPQILTDVYKKTAMNVSLLRYQLFFFLS
jgi:hypothetical protein